MRAPNMQSLTNDLEKKYPGVTIYGIGDSAHKAEVSDHNEDDTPGVRTEQTDPDNVPEHRAIDVMIGSVFTKDAADALVAKMVADPSSRNRLYYIIWHRSIWTAKNNWKPEVYSGSNPHTDHVHFDGLASADGNASSWPVVFTAAGSGPTPPATTVHVVKRGDGGTEVGRIQYFLRNTFPAYRHDVSVRPGVLLIVDSSFGAQTEAWVKEFQSRTSLVEDGIVGPKTFAKLREYGYRY